VSFADLLGFSFQALAGHRLRTLLSLLGVAIGVAAVVLLTSLGQGARLYVTSEFSQLGTNLLIVIPGKTETAGAAPIFGGVPHDLTIEDLEAVARHVRGVARVAPLAFGEAPARFEQRMRYVTVAGTTSGFKGIRQMKIMLGGYLPPGESNESRRVCVIGPAIQREVFGGVNPLGRYLRLGEERFLVIGVLEPRGNSLGMDLDEVVHVPVRSAQRMFNQSGIFRGFVDLHAHADLERAKRAVLELLRERHGGVEDVTVLTQDAVLSTFERIIGTLTAALVGIAAISLSVAGTGIMNVMLVSVSERTAEIGLLKAVGAARRQLVACFLVEAAILASAGGVCGVAAALALNGAFRALYPAFPIEPPPWAIPGAVAVSLVVGLVFGALPARRAARLDPVAALGRR
jgi:putative ABC transport system permease protein